MTLDQNPSQLPDRYEGSNHSFAILQLFLQYPYDAQPQHNSTLSSTSPQKEPKRVEIKKYLETQITSFILSNSTYNSESCESILAKS